MISQWRRNGALLICMAVLAPVGLFASPAQAYTETRQSTHTDARRLAPTMWYDKNNGSGRQATLNSKLTVFVTVNRTRYKIVMRGGSGNGTKSECVSDRGQLPNGVYSKTDGDPRSTLQFLPNKTWGEAEVRGAVWQLGNKKCKPKPGERGTVRTALFIHSQGQRGWNNRNYASAGCIKINQVDRGHLARRWKDARLVNKAYLVVR